MARDIVELVTSAYGAFNQGRLEEFLDLLDDDFVYQARPELPGGGTYIGREAFEGAIRGLREVFTDVRFEPEEVVEALPIVVVALRQTARGRTSGLAVDERIHHLWMFRGERVAHLRVFAARADALEAAGLADQPERLRLHRLLLLALAGASTGLAPPGASA